MPRRRDHPEKVNDQHPPDLEFARDYTVSLVGISRDGSHVQAGDQSEPEIQNVKQQKYEQEHSRDALKKVKPVPAVRVAEYVVARLARYHNPVDRMEQQRQKDPEYFNEQQIRHVVDIFDVFIEYSRTVQGRRIRVKVYEIKKRERHDAGQLMKFAQQEGCAEFYRHCRSDRTFW